MSSSQEITDLVSNSRYNIEILPKLESFLVEQTKNPALNHLEANLAILKFYQFNPQKTQKNFVAQILTKGLMNKPHNDFFFYLSLIPEKIQKEQIVTNLIELENLLETAKFEKFWKEYKKCAEVFDTVVGFEDAIKEFILNCIELSFNSISKEFLGQILNTTNVDKIIEKKGWSSKENNYVVIPKSQVSRQKTQTVGENIKFGDLTKILVNL